MRRSLLLLAITTVASAVIVASALAVTRDPRLDACAVGLLRIEVQSAFEMPRPGDYREAIPRMGLSPELDDLPGPALVVVYRDGYPGPYWGRPGRDSAGRRPEPGTHDICIVAANGEVNVYGNVDLAGLKTIP